MWVGLAALSLAVATVDSPAEAQVVAPAGRTLFNEGVLLRSVLRFDTFDEPNPGDDFRRLRNVYALVWGARPHLSLSFVAPVVRTERSAPGGVGRETVATGTGDATVFARYDVLRRTVPGGYTRLAPELGVKLPTGGTFGTGSTDIVAGLIFSHVRDPDWWITDVQLTLPGTGDEGRRAGNRRRLDLAYLRRVYPRGGLGVPMALLVLELNGESVEQSAQDGATLRGTGGEVLFFSPGFEYIVNRRVVLEASVPIAIYDHLSDARPKPRVSVILGVRWLF